MTVKETLRRIARARLRPAPERMPEPNERIKLGKGYDVIHRVAMCEAPDKRVSRFFVRYKKEPIVMSRDWLTLLEHMDWDFG